MSQFYDGRTVFERPALAQPVYFATLPAAFDAALFPPSHDQSRSFRADDVNSDQFQLLDQPANVFIQTLSWIIPSELVPEAESFNIEQPNLDWLWSTLLPSFYAATQINSFVVDETPPGVLNLLDQPIDGWMYASQVPFFTVANQSDFPNDSERLDPSLLSQPDNAGSITPTGEVLRQRIRIPHQYGGIHHWTR